MRRWITKEELDLHKLISGDIGASAAFFGAALVEWLSNNSASVGSYMIAGLVWVFISFCRCVRLAKEFPIESN